MNRWHLFHAACVRCDGTDRPYHARGLCDLCYAWHKYRATLGECPALNKEQRSAIRTAQQRTYTYWGQHYEPDLRPAQLRLRQRERARVELVEGAPAASYFDALNRFWQPVYRADCWPASAPADEVVAA